jgi:hypothetical protein
LIPLDLQHLGNLLAYKHLFTSSISPKGIFFVADLLVNFVALAGDENDVVPSGFLQRKGDRSLVVCRDHFWKLLDDLQFPDGEF